MDDLLRQVSRARRRLTWQLFLRLLSYCWGAALLLATPVILANWHWQWGWPAWQVPVGALVAGLAAALTLTRLRQADLMQAAIELDIRFGLKERVSSALALGPDDRETEIGQALTADAARRVRDLHVGEHFSVRLGRWSAIPLLPAALAAALIVFLPKPQAVQASLDPAPTTAEEKKPAARAADQLKRKLEAKKKELEQADLPEKDELFDRLERGLEQVRNAADKKEAVVKINELADELNRRREALGSADKLKQQLSQLKGMQDGPADKLADALKNGDLNKAIQELDKLKEQLANEQLTAEEREKLAEQMNQMQEKLEKAAQAMRDQQEALEKQLAQAQAAGDKQAADRIQQQLDRMAANQDQMQRMQDMAEKLGQCSQCMKQGKNGEAIQALQDMQDGLADLQQQLDQLDTLDGALDDLAQSKQDLLDDRPGQMQMGGQGRGQQDGRPGPGLGEGRGAGDRPEEKTDGNKFVDTQVRQQTGQGAAVIVGDAGGPNQKGRVQQEIKQELQAGRSEQSDPLTGQQLPKGYREHAKKYFDAIREGR